MEDKEEGVRKGKYLILDIKYCREINKHEQTKVNKGQKSVIM